MQTSFNIAKSTNAIHHISILKKKNHMIISLDEGILYKIQYPLMIKTPSKPAVEENLLSLIKNIYKKPKLTLHLVLGNDAFPLRSETRQRCLTSLLVFSIILEVLVTAIRQEKKIQIGKKEVKLSLFTDDVTLSRKFQGINNNKNPP